MSTTSKFTAGPWHTDGLVVVAGKPSRWIASVACDSGDFADERRANLAAITAVPDIIRECTRAGGLLWMAEEWFRTAGHKSMNAADFEGNLQSARAALAKSGAA